MNWPRPSRYVHMEASHPMRTESDCLSVLRSVRWADGRARCVKCGSRNVVGDGTAGPTNKYRCKKCGLYFNDKSRTIFQDTKVPLSKWLEAALMMEEKDSVTRISKRIGLSYRNTYYMVRKLEGDAVASKMTQALKHAGGQGGTPEHAVGSTAETGRLLGSPSGP